jgi:lipid A 4'-phosphatase
LKRFLVFSVLFAALFVVVPEVDLWLESLFYSPDEGFFLGDTVFAQFWYQSIPIVRNWVVIPVCLGLLIVWGVRRRPPLGIDSRALLLFVLTLGLGSGLLVNVVFKDQWGRARPRDIVEFGGSKEFTPAFVMTDQACSCSWWHGGCTGSCIVTGAARASADLGPIRSIRSWHHRQALDLHAGPQREPVRTECAAGR